MLHSPRQSSLVYSQKSWVNQMKLQKEEYSKGMSVLTSHDHGENSAGRDYMASDIVTSSLHTAGVSFEGISEMMSSEVNDVDCSLTLGTTKKESKGCPLYSSRSMSSSASLNPFDYQLQLKLSTSPSSMEENFVGKGCPDSSLRHWVSLAKFSAKPDRMKTIAEFIGSGRGDKSGEYTMFGRSRLPSWSATEARVTPMDVESTRRDNFLIDHGPSLELQLSRSGERNVLQQVSCLKNEARLEDPDWRSSNGRLGGTMPKEGTEVRVNTYTRSGYTGEIPRICADCGTTKTPLWRNGPRGPKSLCNACGIRFKKSGRRADMAQGFSPATTATVTGKRKVDMRETLSQQWAEVRPILKRSKLATTAAAESSYDCSADQGTSCTTTIESTTTVAAACSSSMTTRDFFSADSVSAGEDLIDKSRKDNVKRDSPTRRVCEKDEEEGAVLLMTLSIGLVKA